MHRALLPHDLLQNQQTAVCTQHPQAATSQSSTRSPQMPPEMLHLFALPLPNHYSNPTQAAQSSFCATGSAGSAVTHAAGPGSTCSSAKHPALSALLQPLLQEQGLRELGAPSLGSGINGTCCSVETKLQIQGGVASKGLEGQQGIAGFPVAHPLQSLNASVRWSSLL